MSDSDYPSVVTDTTGTQYRLGGMLGEGAQGTVLAVRGKPLAVKLLKASSQAARQRLQEAIARVKRLPLEGLHVARPLRTLAAPHVGYVMELMTDMRSLQDLAHVPADRLEDVTSWYIETGGLLHRLRVLANAAEVLGQLHGRGLTYGDASPRNIVVSKALDACEAWLIDCDNIESGVIRRALYTPGYAAPELFHSHGSDSLTDAWSFATIAFQTLCLQHPFVGDAVHDGEPEREERAYEAKLPWIDAPDGSNEASRGLPRELVMSDALRKLAQDCFGTSVASRQARPSVAAWSEKLHRAADQVLVCNACKSSFYLNNWHCPWCGQRRPAFAVASVFLRDLSLTDTTRNPFHLVGRGPRLPLAVARMAIQSQHKVDLTDRILRGTLGRTPLLTLELGNALLKIRGEVGASWNLQHGTNNKVLALAGRTESLDLTADPSSWWLIPSNPQDVHRVIRFEWQPEAKS